MADIEKLIQDLQSDNPDKRFQACNQLFYAQTIPDSVIDALREATQDQNHDVANAAHRALEIHTIQTTSISPIEMNYIEKPSTETRWNRTIGLFFTFITILSAILLFGLFSFVGFLILEYLEEGELINWICLAPLIYSLPTIVFLILYIRFRWWESNNWKMFVLIILTSIQIIVLLYFYYGIFGVKSYYLPWPFK
jgi:hypothetical protein